MSKLSPALVKRLVEVRILKYNIRTSRTFTRSPNHKRSYWQITQLLNGLLRQNNKKRPASKKTA
jgi:hypothetical protein